MARLTGIDGGRSSVEAMIEEAKSKKQKEIKEKASEALAKNKQQEGSDRTSESDVTNRLQNIEHQRNEVALLENFINDPENRDVVDNSPDLVKKLKGKKDSLSGVEGHLDRYPMASSIEGLGPDVREEMASQYLLETNPGIRDLKETLNLKGRGVGSEQWGNQFGTLYDKVDESLDNLPDVFKQAELSSKMEKHIIEDLKNSIEKEINEVKSGSKGEYKGAWGVDGKHTWEGDKEKALKNFEKNYPVWQNFYTSLVREAGMNLEESRTNRNIEVPGWVKSLDIDAFVGGDADRFLSDQAHSNAIYREQYKEQLSILESARGAKGFLGIGTLGKKKEALKHYHLPEGIQGTIDDSSVDTLDKNIDTLIGKINQAIENSKKMEKVMLMAKQKSPEIMRILKETPLATIWKVEVLQHGQDKLAQLESDFGN